MRKLLLPALAASLLLTAAPAAAAPSWLAPIDLGAESGAPHQSTGRVALGPDGTAVAAWAQSDGVGNHVLQVARRKPGEGYGAPITVPGTTGTADARVGVDAAGNATILFRLGGVAHVVPWASAAGAPGALQALQPLVAGASPELAVGRNGTAVATWLDVSNPSTPRVRAAVRGGPAGDFSASDFISQFGNGPDSITGLRVAVGDGGHATAVWSRTNSVPQTLVEANERVPGGGFFSGSATFTSDPASTEPAVAVDPAGRSTVLWTRGGQLRYAEHAPSEPAWSPERRVSTLPNTESTPAAGAAPSGAVIAAWVSNGAIFSASRPPGGGAFGTPQPISGPGMNPQLPIVAVGGNGDALLTWSLGDNKSIPVVHRRADGSFGPILTAVTAANQPPGENHSYFQPSIGIDDQGNGVAAWTRIANRGGTDFVRFQTASYDAAAPALTSSVPPGGATGAPIGMAAAATDRVSPVAIAWNFGDGGTAAGGAVSHAFGTAGAFTVTVTATDGAGNQTSATHPVLITATPPPPKKRIRSKVSVGWAVQNKKIWLLRMAVPNTPRKTRVQLRCKGKKCPFKRVSSKKRRKGTIRLFKTVTISKVQRIERRTFRAGQRLELRITAPGYIGKVVRYRLRNDQIPKGKDLCLPVGAKKPRKRCP